jgi:subtilase family serine protease
MPITVSDVSRPLPPFERPPSQDRRPSRYVKALVALMAAGVIAGCASSHDSSSLTPQGRSHQNISGALPATSPSPVPADQAGCTTNAGSAHCGAKKNPQVNPSNTYSAGLTPAQLRAAYGLPAAIGTGTPSGPVIAVVDAFDDPNAERDLGTYRTQFALPACTAKNGCFQTVQLKPAPGSAGPPPAPPGTNADATTWADEIALDLAMASAACPNCRLLLVEAAGQDLDSLASAVNAAASYNPAAISNSWGVPEGGGNVPNIDPGAQAAFNHPGIAITASAGELGTGQVQFPASSPFVTSVGGTTLTQDGSTRGWSETAWTSTGTGCSIMFNVPSWQPPGSCTGRSVPDVSFVGDYNTGVAVYSSAQKGWVVLGGTSVGAPFVAGLYAQAADYGALTTGASNLYANLSNLNVVAGAAGQTNGSPNGLAGF